MRTRLPECSTVPSTTASTLNSRPICAIGSLLLPGAQLSVQLSQLQRVGRDLIKLFRVGTVRAFDPPFRWKMRGVWSRATWSIEQCHRLHHAEGRAGGAAAGDPRRTRPQAI